MPITAPVRKGLKARALADSNPGLTVAEVARRQGLDRGAAAKAMAQERFGRDKPKSRV